MIPAQKDDIKIMNFELLIISELLNARSVMNIDIVNPIPPRIATENNMLHEISTPENFIAHHLQIMGFVIVKGDPE